MHSRRPKKKGTRYCRYHRRWSKYRHRRQMSHQRHPRKSCHRLHRDLPVQVPVRWWFRHLGLWWCHLRSFQKPCHGHRCRSSRSAKKACLICSLLHRLYRTICFRGGWSKCKQPNGKMKFQPQRSSTSRRRSRSLRYPPHGK